MRLVPGRRGLRRGRRAGRATRSPSCRGRCGGRSSWCSSSPGLAPHFAEIVAAEDVTACKPDPQGYQPGPRGAGARRRRAASSSRTRCRVWPPPAPPGMRCAMLSTSHGEDSLSAADLVWRDFVGRVAGRPAVGPCLISTSRSSRERLEAVRAGVGGGGGPSRGLPGHRTGRAHLPAGSVHQRSRASRRRQPDLRRHAHAEGDDRGGRVGRCARAARSRSIAPAAGRELGARASSRRRSRRGWPRRTT